MNPPKEASQFLAPDLGPVVSALYSLRGLLVHSPEHTPALQALVTSITNLFSETLHYVCPKGYVSEIDRLTNRELVEKVIELEGEKSYLIQTLNKTSAALEDLRRKHALLQKEHNILQGNNDLLSAALNVSPKESTPTDKEVADGGLIPANPILDILGITNGDVEDQGELKKSIEGIIKERLVIWAGHVLSSSVKDIQLRDADAYGKEQYERNCKLQEEVERLKAYIKSVQEAVYTPI